MAEEKKRAAAALADKAVDMFDQLRAFRLVFGVESFAIVVVVLTTKPLKFETNGPLFGVEEDQYHIVQG